MNRLRSYSLVRRSGMIRIGAASSYEDPKTPAELDVEFKSVNDWTKEQTPVVHEHLEHFQSTGSPVASEFEDVVDAWDETCKEFRTLQTNWSVERKYFPETSFPRYKENLLSIRSRLYRYMADVNRLTDEDGEWVKSKDEGEPPKTVPGTPPTPVVPPTPHVPPTPADIAPKKSGTTALAVKSDGAGWGLWIGLGLVAGGVAYVASKGDSR